MLDGGAQGDARSQRVTHDVGLLDPEVLHQRGDIAGQGLVSHGAVDIGGAPVGLQIHPNHAPGIGE